MRGKRIRTAVFGVVVGLMSVAGCATSRTDFVVALPNGYQIVRDKTSAPTIIKKRGGVVVPGPVASYTVIRDVVAGVVESPAVDQKQEKPAEQHVEAAKSAGNETLPAARNKTYFVLDTRTGEVGKGLSESAYNERLKSLNIPPAPELSPPVLPQ